MPYSEEKPESTQTKMTTNCSSDLAFTPDNEFVELVWENGQILLQGQSSRTRRNPSSSSGFPTHVSKPQEKDGGDAITPKMGRFGTMDSVLNDFSSPGSSGQMGLGHDEDMVPWLNYHLDDTLQHDYCSEFFSELTNGNMNPLSGHANAVPSVVGPEPNRPRNNNHLGFSPLQQCQTSVPSVRSRVSDYTYHQAPLTSSSPLVTKTQKQVLGHTRPPLQPNNNTGLMNFSHFSRAASLAKINLQGSNFAETPSSSSVERLKSNDKRPASGSSNLLESTLIESNGGGSTSLHGFRSQTVSMQGNVDSKSSISMPHKESETVFREDAFRNTRLLEQSLAQTSSFAASTAKPDNEKDVEPVVASSSLCSGNIVGGASNDIKHTLKRKARETEDSEYHSEDVEEESVGVRKPATNRGGGNKRSRAAEVHNLSERRRRDRINEKMRALQELIPNCNKVDKASMLDEAIEYLKTLQLQVQIMSMGAGMYMPPMMLPTGMHAPHFSPMGVGMGMGMGMGYGMGMGIGMGHGMQFPRPPLTTSLPMMPGSTLQMLGLPGQGHPMPVPGQEHPMPVPGQGHPMAVPRAPYPLSEGPSTTPVLVPGVSGKESLLQVSDSALPSSSKGPMQNKNLQLMPNTDAAECAQNQTNVQVTGYEMLRISLLQETNPLVA
ncbi:hypothetical protein GIB67_024898 [Kingdonia uniflora]|uniref:BHLH domain-containing protein n=1 Tax=Kingdonia uniflora TaxID=39325 RepID=A0A7J7NYK7_9MAGN|nr:hypothetical protein GIB67_024898 [Kingdonia uniflora]